MGGNIRVECQEMYGVIRPADQVKYGVISPIEGIQNQTMYGVISPVEQVKYGVISPIEGVQNQTMYGVISPTMPQQVKYAPAPVIETTAVPFPEQVKYAPAPVYPEQFDTLPEQVKYAPAPIVTTIIIETMPLIETAPPVETTTTSGTDDSAVASVVVNTEEIVNTKKFIEEIDTVINDLETFHNNSGYVSGAFGDAMAYSSGVIKNNIGSLKDFSEQNMLPVMNNVGQYQENVKQINDILRPMVGDFSMSQFDENGIFTATSEQMQNADASLINKAQELFKKNKLLKQQIEALSNSRIHRG